MRRREFITLLGGAAARGRLRRAPSRRARSARRGARSLTADDQEGQARVSAFPQGLQQLGWASALMCGSTRDGAEAMPNYSQICGGIGCACPGPYPCNAGLGVEDGVQATRTLPIVFANVVDPVGPGFVASLARPGGNATGFTHPNMASAVNGWNCSRRLRRALRGRQSSGRGVTAAMDIWRYPVRGAVAWGGDKPDRLARCRRHGARRSRHSHGPNGGLIVRERLARHSS